jgi:hypothetical protein
VTPASRGSSTSAYDRKSRSDRWASLTTDDAGSQGAGHYDEDLTA